MAKFKFSVSVGWAPRYKGEEEIVEIPDEDLAGLSASEREKTIWAEVERWADQHVETNYEEVEA